MNQGCHAVLAAVSRCYSPLEGRSPTRYSPVRRSTRELPPFRARLACVRHAASVDSEPGSNSPVKLVTSLTRRPSLLKVLFGPCELNLAGIYCVYPVFKEPRRLRANLTRIPNFGRAVNPFSGLLRRGYFRWEERRLRIRRSYGTRCFTPRQKEIIRGDPPGVKA